MAVRTEFLVIPFIEIKKKVKAGTTEPQKSEAAAIRAANRIGATKAGAVALSQIVDPDTDYFGEPQILAQVGRVPDEFLAALNG